MKTLIMMLIMLSTLEAFAVSNIDPNNKHAWSTNAGWIDFRTDHGSVTVYPDHLEGYAWAENLGWIQLGSHNSGGTHTYANSSNNNWGVNNDGAGKLSGYAWSSHIGWINFTQVTINQTTGDFNGDAWSENVGWIRFNGSPTYKVRVENQQTNQPPQAVFSINPTQGTAPLTVTFDASGSYDPDGSIVNYEWAANDQPFATGNPFSYTFTSAFEYQGPIKLTVTDNQGLTGTTQQNVSITVTNQQTDSVGQAIIIAGPLIDDNLFPYSNEFTQRMYRLLKKRRFGDDDVHYMNLRSPDIKLDGFPEHELLDYNLFNPEQQLSEAFARAAARLSAGQQFIFYLHAHGRENRVYLTNYELSASQLRDLLATLPAGTQQLIIIDTCYSGSFLDELAGVENRVVVTSADDRHQAWQIELRSFADKFLRLLEHGSHVLEAFREAEDMILEEHTLFNEQRPWLDDNGDGQYLNNDGALAANIYIGGQGISQAPPPVITQVSPRSTLHENVSTAKLWVKTSSSGSSSNIYKVQAVLVNPNYVLSDYQGEATDFSRIELELKYNPDQDRYEVDYDGFCTAGTWRILYQAQDTDGTWSDIVKGEVQVQVQDCINMHLNQFRYSTGDQLRVDMEVSGNAVVDMYVAIVFPDGILITVGYPLEFSWPNAIVVYQANVEIPGQQTFSIMNFPLPSGVTKGQYGICGILAKAGSDPQDQRNWIDLDCPGFEVY
jgi:PKD repeat protein